jgi:N-acetyl-anhydromuramyl-L-alanine amidase AmpD
MREIDYIILHHSGTPATNGVNDPDGKQIYEAICRNHHTRAVKENWGENYKVDYHFLIGSTGKVFEGQPVEMVGYHCGNYSINLKSIGICLLGDFEKIIPPKLQVDALIDLIVDLIKKYKIPIENIKKHQQIVNTDCPGKYFPFNTVISEVKNKMSDEFSKAWDLMLRWGIFKPDGSEDYPTRPITRKEFAVLLVRLVEHLKST